jgi:hypothetical protein
VKALKASCEFLLSLPYMKRFSILALIVTGLTIATLTSCSKDDSSSNSSSTADARDLSVGKYIGTFTTEIAGQTNSDSAVFDISKGANNTINILEDGINILTGTIVTTGTNYKSSIPAQTIKTYDETDSTEMTFDIIGNGNDHVSFESSSKKFTYSFKLVGGQLDGLIVTTTGIKQ